MFASTRFTASRINGFRINASLFTAPLLAGSLLATTPALGAAHDAAPKSAASKTPKVSGTTATAAATFADIEKNFGFVPQFFRELPALVVPGVWEEMKTLEMNPQTALPGKVKDLIDLAVAAQIPCMYCIESGTAFAKLDGATQAEIGEAVATAANTRHWSTFLNGIQTDETKFRAEIAQFVANAKAASTSDAPAPKPIDVADGASALKDIEQSFGMVPDFLKRFPDEARAGAWRTFKDLQLNPEAALPAKEKDLISLGVASQIPCKFCIISDSEFAKRDGATDAEITEAIAVASFTREMSTLLNGMRVDQARFHADLNRVVKGAEAAAKAATKASPNAAATAKASH